LLRSANEMLPMCESEYVRNFVDCRDEVKGKVTFRRLPDRSVSEYSVSFSSLNVRRVYVGCGFTWIL